MNSLTPHRCTTLSDDLAIVLVPVLLLQGLSQNPELYSVEAQKKMPPRDSCKEERTSKENFNLQRKILLIS